MRTGLHRALHLIPPPFHHGMSAAPEASDTRGTYGMGRLILYALAALGGGVLVAGFWNYHLVDGFGRDFVAGGLIGQTEGLAGAFGDRGAGFGFLFAGVAGLAATFTACNCVVFAMLPGLACTADRGGGTEAGPARRNDPWWTLGAFVAGVTGISVVYGLQVGWIGPAAVEALNVPGARIGRAQTVFTLLGSVLLVWGVAEMGFLDAVARRLSPSLRAFLASGTVKAGALGLLVGLFAVGRPFPVFQEFLTYAAQAGSPLYGAAVMTVQGMGQILVMVVAFLLLVRLAGPRLLAWSRQNPAGPRLLSGMALLAGGAFFVFYWGLAFAFDVGRWGFKLGWY